MKKLYLIIFTILYVFSCENPVAPEIHEYKIEDFFNYTIGNTYEYKSAFSRDAYIELEDLLDTVPSAEVSVSRSVRGIVKKSYLCWIVNVMKVIEKKDNITYKQQKKHFLLNVKGRKKAKELLKERGVIYDRWNGSVEKWGLII